MDFADKYISAEDLKLDLTSKKVPLSNDAFALAEMIESLMISLNNVSTELRKSRVTR